MKVILNDHVGSPGFEEALKELANGAHTLSVAVSYMQVSGWEIFHRHTRELNLPAMRIVCTDQLGVTQPAAVERAIRSGVQIRNFSGNVVYHPKVFLAHDRNLKPTRFLLGSANLSLSAFTKSAEAGFLGTDGASLVTLKNWFDRMFATQTEEFTASRLGEMEIKWRRLAAERTKNRLNIRRGTAIPPGGLPLPIGPEDLDALEDVFATIQLPVGLLNMDYAGNNIRNIAKMREVLKKPAYATGKQKSELKLLGFMQNGSLTALGAAAAAATSEAEVARLWCRWLQQTANSDLEGINSKLLVAKRVFPQFWKLQPEVQNFFLANARNPSDRWTLQTIELLCNARDVVQELSLLDMKSLSVLLNHPARLPLSVRNEIADYFDNKGTRSWSEADRRTVPEAWRAAVEMG
jgi:HKD family nuclease